MIPAEHVADGCCAFSVRLVTRQPVLIHSIKNSSVNGFETVADVRKRSFNYDRHCVLYKGFLHFLYKLCIDYVLLGIHYILGLIILMCHLSSPPYTSILTA